MCKLINVELECMFYKKSMKFKRKICFSNGLSLVSQAKFADMLV